MTMNTSRVFVAVVGILLPYLARLPGGADWLAQYSHGGPDAWLFLGGFNAIAWVAIVAISLLYRHAASLLAPSLLGFGFLAWAHGSLDLASDAQAALALIFIPIYALLPIGVGGMVGYVMDRRLRRSHPVRPTKPSPAVPGNDSSSGTF
ncbi:MAG: hypothetical protein M3Y93_01550 [Pseudomonadota bacterium]|nr:hypothetical protein [Pseudomonadota bacterium]